MQTLERLGAATAMMSSVTFAAGTAITGVDAGTVRTQNQETTVVNLKTRQKGV